MAVLLPCAIVLGIFWALLQLIGWPAAMLWNVAVLYVTLGFRQFSHHFTHIRDALDSGDEFVARQALADWQQVDASEVPRSAPTLGRRTVIFSTIFSPRLNGLSRVMILMLSFWAMLSVPGMGIPKGNWGVKGARGWPSAVAPGWWRWA